MSHSNEDSEVANEAPKFTWASLWQKPAINSLNGKSYTLPIFNLNNPYGRNFHLSWLGFFVAFLSWFAFPPLIPEAIKADLGLTSAQVANSNIVALSATLIVRLISGPLVDRYGPRIVMASLLILGAIPSGLAGTANNASSLYVIRFFIGILGGTFVPCQAWTSSFFDKNIVGTANAFVGGWGIGGATYAIMVSLYSRLHSVMDRSKAWRVAFVAVPVPTLLLTAALTLIYGTDHPAGKWSDRHKFAAGLTGAAATQAEKANEKDKETGAVTVHEVNSTDLHELHTEHKNIVTVDIAVNQPLTFKSAMQILSNPLTWLPALAYMTTFGFELAVDSVLAHVLMDIDKNLTLLNAGYLASVFGLLNIWTRPFGGYVADRLYVRFGVAAKKWITLVLGVLQGVFTVGFGYYIHNLEHPDLGVVMGFIVLIAICNEMANGTNFSLVPHCNSYNNGVMSGLVGAFGNVGGIFFALIFRFQPHRGTPWIISGFFALGVNLVLMAFPAPRA
ncbi:nitrate/nitrite porter [Pterulicium gracile]|uniref:Nitrate/nitrite transporter n=1 Tax=Pterulicium gracile TaxID=1884261 RepID=A0A5C3QGS0_9AGAR|nr:nitrate/nitrite porter [Pterula gracilis]